MTTIPREIYHLISEYCRDYAFVALRGICRDANQCAPGRKLRSDRLNAALFTANCDDITTDTLRLYKITRPLAAAKAQLMTNAALAMTLVAAFPAIVNELFYYAATRYIRYDEMLCNYHISNRTLGTALRTMARLNNPYFQRLLVVYEAREDDRRYTDRLYDIFKAAIKGGNVEALRLVRHVAPKTWEGDHEDFMRRAVYNGNLDVVLELLAISRDYNLPRLNLDFVNMDLIVRRARPSRFENHYKLIEYLVTKIGYTLYGHEYMNIAHDNEIYETLMPISKNVDWETMWREAYYLCSSKLIRLCVQQHPEIIARYLSYSWIREIAKSYNKVLAEMKLVAPHLLEGKKL